MNDSRFNKTFIIQPALGSDSYLSGTTFDNNTIYYNMSNAVSAFTTDLSSLVLNDVGQLTAVDEGNGIGYILKDRVAGNYGSIGENAKDFSFSDTTSTTKGATGAFSFAEGFNTIASGDYSYAGGYFTEASGFASHAEGNFTEASGSGSHAEGFNTTASGTYSHAEGYFTEASGTYSHAEGYFTEASGYGSHAEGSETIASGQYSHAEGRSTIASGFLSHAEGYKTLATGQYSHVQGYYNYARGVGEHSGGIYCTDYIPNNDDTDRLVNYGNGTNGSRDDAFTIYRNGAVRFYRATTGSITNSSKEGLLIYDSDDNNRPTIHNGTEWKGLAYVDELGISWGDIQGSLLDQTDLVSVLNDKASIDQPVFNGEVGIIGNLHFKNNGNKIFGGNSRSNFIEMYDSQTGGINLRTLNGTSPVNIEGGLNITGQFTTDESIKLDRGKAFEGVNNSSFLPYDSANGNMVLTPSTLGSYGKIRFNYGPNSLEGFRLTHLGDVGIGTTSPSTKLDVNGVAKATEFKTTNTGITFNEGGSQYGIIRNSGSGFLTFRGLQSGASGYQFFVNNTTEVLNISNDGTITGISFVGDGSLLTDLDYNNISNTPTLFSGDYNDLSNKPDLSVLNDTIVEPTINNFPATGLVDSVYIAEDTGYMYRWNGSSYTQLTDQTAIWGEISGTLSNQTDLQNVLDGKADNADVFSGAYVDLTGKPTLFSGDYDDLLNLPTLFSGNYNDLSNKPSLFSGNYNDLSNLPNLSTVATSGNYDDLLNLPTLFSGAYVDLTGKPTLFSGDYDDLNNKPNLSTVATSGNYDDLLNLPTLFSGDYDDLLNLPTLFSGNYGDLNNKPNLSTVATSGAYNDLLNLPNLSIYVDKSSNETIGGEKTFTSNSIFNGNVGIGTTSPSTKLDVVGTIKGTEVVDNNGNTLSQKIDSKTINEPNGSDVVANIVSLTQAEYDAATPISTTFYIITD